VAVDNNDGNPVRPSLDVIRSGSYKPLSRPMFLYVNTQAYKRPEVKAFLDFILANAKEIVEHPRVNYVALSDTLYRIGQKRLTSGTTGSAMATSGKRTTDLAAIFDN
jgi:phosphate transport system substrate-binding protein